MEQVSKTTLRIGAQRAVKGQGISVCAAQAIALTITGVIVFTIAVGLNLLMSLGAA